MLLYTQNYNPLHITALSTAVAAVPVMVMFYLLVFRRCHVPLAAAGGAIAAILLALTVYQMPPVMVGLAFTQGALFGIFPVCWSIITAMFLYNITVETGRFEGIRNSIAGLSGDHRLQAVLIAFAFGAFLEGAAGGGTPVAICAAMLVGLGFSPFLAAGLCLIANTSPVAYGGFGTPILTLNQATGLDALTLSKMAGNQLPFLSCIVPLWLVRCMCGWKETLEVLPAIVVAGGSFAVSQFYFAHSSAFPLTDIAGGIISLVVTAIFLNFWKPKRVWRFDTHRPEPGQEPAEPHVPMKKMALLPALNAWLPYILLCVVMVYVGTHKKQVNDLQIGPLKASYTVPLNGLNQQVRRTPPVVEKETLEKATFDFAWATMPGTSVLATALFSLLLFRVTREQFRRVVQRTVQQMSIPVPTIVGMLGMAAVTRYAGMDATLGMAFAYSGKAYPFFAAMLGWLGVFLTGTDAGSNALFGSLQKITAFRTGLNPILICVANSTGGVMGKMIDAQSICVATAATEKVGTEADIFKYVIWHSVALACLVGIITLLQSYVPPFTAMVPH